jgi:hypothetical protein
MRRPPQGGASSSARGAQQRAAGWTERPAAEEAGTEAGESAESACTPEDSASTTCSMTSSDTCSKASERITDPALAATAQMPTKGAARVGWRRGRRRWGGADAD